MGFEGMPRQPQKVEEYDSADTLAESTNAVTQELLRRTKELELQRASNDNEPLTEGEISDPAPDLKETIERLQKAA